MDFRVSGSDCGANAVVVWANRFQFAPGETITHRRVESRALIWGKAGLGRIETDGLVTELAASHFVFTRWCHHITYRADFQDPFMVGAVHVVPWHDRAVPVELHAAHGQGGHPNRTTIHRRDEDWATLRGAFCGIASSNDRLLMVADLAVGYLQQDRPEASYLRALAVLLINELQAIRTRPQSLKPNFPPGLIRMQEFITSHLARPLAITQVAAAGGMSVSSAERLFHRYLGTTVGKWITTQRMTRAADLLRTTNQPVSVVGRAVGFTDPAYFSRTFRREHGVPPRTYAAQARLA